MKDRIPNKPNRRKITFEDDNTVKYAKIEYADEPIEEGTPLNKGNLLSDETALKFGLAGDSATVNNALGKATGRTYINLAAVPNNRYSSVNLSVSRNNVAAATDANGAILVGGGGIYNDISGAVDRFNIDGTRESLSSMATARKAYAATNDGAGNVLFGGGNASFISYSGSSSVDRYTPSGVRTTLPSLSDIKIDLTASRDGAGNALFAGGYYQDDGYGYYVASVDRYDTSGTKITTPRLSVGRYNLSSSTDGNGNVLIGGGFRSSGASSVVDIYTPEGVRTTAPSLSESRGQLASGTDGSGAVLFAGGASHYQSSAKGTVDKYTVEGIRTTLPSLASPRKSLTASTDKFGNVLFGGGNSTDHYGGMSSAVESYSVDGVRTTLDPLSQARAYLASATDGNGGVSFFGGMSGSGSGNTHNTRDIYVYKKEFIIPKMHAYRFPQHTAEQPASLVDKTIYLTESGVGYLTINTTINI